MTKSDKTKRAADNKSFDELLGDLSLRLLKVNPQNIDSEIRQAVMEIGEHYGVDSVQLRKFGEDRSVVTLLHWWSSSNKIGLTASLPNEAIPWATSLILRGKVVRIGRLSDMPPEASAGRAMMEKDGLRAAMLIPLIVSDEVFGAFVLASQEEREWSDEIVRESQLLGGALAYAYERAQLHNSLWSSEARLRAVVENQTEFIVRWLPDGTRTWVNDRYCEFFQESRGSLIGTSVLRLVPPADRQKVLKKVKEMTPDNPVQTGEYLFLLPSGETGWQRWSDKGIFDESGTLIEIQSVGSDITDRKRAEEAQIESEIRYRNLVESTTDWIWEMNLDRVHTYSNNQLEVILGYSADELQALSFEQLFHPEDLLVVEERLPELIDSKSGWEQWELRFRHKNGDFRHLQSNATPVLDADGNLRGYRGIDRDITDSVMSRDTIDKSEQKYRTVVESANDFIWMVDGERISDCNQKAMEILGRDREDLIGKTPWDIDITPEYQPDGSASKDKGRAIVKDVNSGRPRRFDWVHHGPDGTAIDMEVSLTPIELTHDGHRVLAVGRDITDSKRAQQEIERGAKFQARLAALSTDLLKCGHEETVEFCRLELERIGEEYEVDGAGVWWYPSDRQTIHRVVAWRREDLPYPPPPDSLELADLSWSRRLLLAGDTIIIDDVAQVPADVKSTGEMLRKFGVEAVLAFSDPVKDVPWGACACIFSVGKPHKWSDEAVQQLQLLGAPLSNALTRFLAFKEISRHADFQSRLAELSTELATAQADETDARVEQALGRIGVDYRLDVISLWWISGEHGEMERRAGWRIESPDDDRPSAPDHSNTARMPWTAGLVLKGETVKIDDVDTLPDEGGVDRARWQGFGIKSVLGFPLQVQESIGGVFFFTSFEQRSWDEETVQELRLVANTVSGACIRHWAAEEILRREQDLTRSQKIARVGSYSFVPEGSNEDFPPQGKLELSPQFRELYGIDSEQASFEQVVSRIHPDDSKRVVNNIRKAIESGARHVETYRVVRPDGTILHLENRPYNVVDEADQTGRIFGTVQDVTERVESREKIESALAEIEKLKDQLQEENLYLRKEIRIAHGFEKIIGDSPKLREALIAAEKVAPTDVPVLILGETGTGKELIAQAIHDLSGRKDHALISVNCAALSRDLIESELFGHEKGAFTGAHSQRKGRFELADGGTLFLDEIGELQGELQAKLLRVLQTGDFERLGGSQTLHANARLIAATNKNLESAVDDGDFRADLYYRISSFPVKLPPLRDRPEDIPALIEFLVGKHAKRMGKDIQSISARTIRYLTNQKWPGNVRELEGIIQRALISTTGPVLDYAESDGAEPESSTSSDAVPTDESADLRAVERQHILKVLENTRWVIDGKRGAASKMGVAPSTLRSKMKRLGIKRTK